MHRVYFFSLLLLAAAFGTPVLCGQEKVSDEDLEKDPRLEKIVYFEVPNPTVKRVLKILQQKTGVTFAADSQTLDQTLDFLEVEEAAWELMRDILLTKGAKGGWTKLGDGYRLQLRIELETAPAPPPPPPPESTKWWIFALPGVAVLLVSTGGYLYRFGASKSGPKDKKK